MASSTATSKSEHEECVSEVAHSTSSPSSIALRNNVVESSSSRVAGPNSPCRVLISQSPNEVEAAPDSSRSAELVARTQSDSSCILSDMLSGSSSATEPEDRRRGEPTRSRRNSDSPPTASPVPIPSVGTNCSFTGLSEIAHRSQKKEMPREKGDDENQATGKQDAGAKDSEEGIKGMFLGGCGEKIGTGVIAAYTTYDDGKAKGKKKKAQKQETAALGKKGGKPEPPSAHRKASSESSAEGKLPRKKSGEKSPKDSHRKDSLKAQAKEEGPKGKIGATGEKDKKKRKSKGSLGEIHGRDKEGSPVPDLRLVHEVVDNLMDEFKGVPPSKKPPKKQAPKKTTPVSSPHATSKPQKESSPVETAPSKKKKKGGRKSPPKAAVVPVSDSIDSLASPPVGKGHGTKKAGAGKKRASVTPVSSEPSLAESASPPWKGGLARRKGVSKGKPPLAKKEKPTPKKEKPAAKKVQYQAERTDDHPPPALKKKGAASRKVRMQTTPDVAAILPTERIEHDERAEHRFGETDSTKTSSTAIADRSSLDPDYFDENAGQDGSGTVASIRKPVFVLKDPTFGPRRVGSPTRADQRFSRRARDQWGCSDEYLEGDPDEPWDHAAGKCSPGGVTQNSEWSQGDTRKEVGLFSKISKVEGLNIEVDTSSSEGSRRSRRTKVFYCVGQKPSMMDEKVIPMATIQNRQSILKLDKHGNKLLRSESLTSIYEGSSRANVRRRSPRKHRRRASGKREIVMDQQFFSNASFALCPSHSSRKAHTDRSRPSVHRFLCESAAASPSSALRDVRTLKPALKKRLRRSISIDMMQPSRSSIGHRTDKSTVWGSTSTPGYRKPFLCPHLSRPSIKCTVHHHPASRNIPPITQRGPGTTSPLPIRTFRSIQCINSRKPATQIPQEAPAVRIESGMNFRKPANILSYNSLQPPKSSCSRRSQVISNKSVSPPEDVQIVFSPHSLPQSDAASPIAQGAPSKVTVTSYGGSFATAHDFSGIEASMPTTKIIFNGQVVEGPSATFKVPAIPDDPETTIAVQPPAIVEINAAPAPWSLPTDVRSLSPQQEQPLPVTTDVAKFNPTVQSFQVTQSVSGVEADSGTSSSSHVSIVRHARFRDEWENDAPEDKSSGSTLDVGENDSYNLRRENIKRRGNVVLYTVLLLSTLIAITAGSVLYAKRHASSSTEYDDDVDGRQMTWLLGPWFKGDAGAAMYTKSSPCRSPSCSERVVKLFNSLDAQVGPCHNFYGHVCSLRRVNGTANEQMTRLTEFRLVSFFKSRGRTDMNLPVASASRRLWRDCMDFAMLNQLGKAPLQALLKLTGLKGWPYGPTNELPDAWKVAGDLLRLMAVAPLFEISVMANGTLRLSPGNHGGSHDADDVLDAMLTIRRKRSALRELAEDVADLSRQLNTLRDHRTRASSDDERDEAEVLPQQFLDAALMGIRPDVHTVHVEPAGIIDPLVKLVHNSKPQAVLNMLGYRLVRHVDLFTPAVVEADLNTGAASSRESRCARAVLEDALSGDAAEYVRYVALRSHLDFDLVRTLTTHLRHSFLAKLAELTWLDDSTRKSAQAHLRDLKVRFFFERYGDANKSAQARPPAALPSKALATYQRFREARFRSSLLQGAIADEMGDEHCVFDAEHKVLFVRLSALDVRDPQSPLWPVLQAAYLGPRLSRCLLRVLLPAAEKQKRRRDVRWSSAASRRLNATRTCLRGQHDRAEGTGTSWSPAQTALAVADNAALRPARDLFDEYLTRMNDNVPVTEPTSEDVTEKPLSWHQVFYVAYAQSLCEDPDRRRRQAQQNPRWERVNGPLSNDPVFHRAFGCRAGDPMRPEPTCGLWGTPH